MDDESEQLDACNCLFCFVFFLVEWILSTWWKDDYPFGFFFYLDFIATVSLYDDFTPIFFGVGFQEDAGGFGSSAQIAPAWA